MFCIYMTWRRKVEKFQTRGCLNHPQNIGNSSKRWPSAGDDFVPRKKNAVYAKTNCRGIDRSRKWKATRKGPNLHKAEKDSPEKLWIALNNAV
jgi:hypothetical protein